MKNLILKIKYSTYVISIILVTAFTNYSQETSEDVIMHAMKDELKRNMDELTYKDYDKPFYISYTIGDINYIYANAILGALNSSFENKSRDWSIRLMVGDYELNDENFSDLNNSLSLGDGNIDLPIENDYYGIRRSLWMHTNNVYKRASENYRNKISALNQKDVNIDDLQIEDFCRVPVIKVNIESRKIKSDKSKLENIVKELSVLFKEYNDIMYSNVSILQFYTDVYFMNTEGVETKSPLNITTVIANAQTLAEDGEMLANQVAYYNLTIDDLPEINVMKSDIKAMADNLIALRKAPRFDDSYTGPILITNQAVGDLFSKTLFSGLNSLKAHRESLYSAPDMTIFYGQNNNALESKIGKKVISRDISVAAKPFLKESNGIKLIGSFSIDAEGVIPPKELILIKDGMLQNLLNGRTPTRMVKESNGHNRYAIMNGGISKLVGPGVISITSSDGKSKEELKNMLIEAAKEEGLDYAIMIKPIASSSSFKPVNVYKVSIENGNEEIIRSFKLETISTNSLKNILGVSNKEFVYNTMLSGDSEGYNLSMFSSIGSGTRMANGIPTSFIVPDALLLEEIEMGKKQKLISKDLPILENPVGK